MKTNQIISREFMGRDVRQEHQTDFFCINDMTEIANQYRRTMGLPEARWDNYIRNDSTKEFFQELMRQKNIVDIIKSSRGKFGGTWAHPLVFFDYAMWLSPEFKVYVYDWLYDCMTIYRDDSGESYKKMCGYICRTGYSPAKATIVIQSIAKAIKRDIGVSDWNKTTPENLKRRDEIHNGMILLMSADIAPGKAYRLVLESIGIKQNETEVE